MKNFIKLFWITAFAAVIVLGFATLSLTGCDDGEGGGSETLTYKGTSGSNTFTLKITKAAARSFIPTFGDEYELTAGSDTSRGTVATFGGGEFTLQPSNAGAPTFGATVTDEGLTGLTGTITVIDGTIRNGPGALTPAGGPGGSGGSSGLVGKWYYYTECVYEFTSDGKLFLFGAGGDAYSEYSVSGNTIRLTLAGSNIGSARFSISGNTLTLSNFTGAFPGDAGTYTREPSGGGGGSVTVPSQLVGTWENTENENSTFHITSAGKFGVLTAVTSDILPSSTLGASSGTIVYGAHYYGVMADDELGRFSYSISSGRMTISNSTGLYSGYYYINNGDQYIKR